MSLLICGHVMIISLCTSDQPTAVLLQTVHQPAECCLSIATGTA